MIESLIKELVTLITAIPGFNHVNVNFHDDILNEYYTIEVARNFDNDIQINVDKKTYK